MKEDEATFLDKIKGFEPAEGIREQLQCNVVMGIHSLNWASMLLDLAKAPGDEKLRQRAMQTANYITYYLQPDNRIVVGFRYNQWWYRCHTAWCCICWSSSRMSEDVVILQSGIRESTRTKLKERES